MQALWRADALRSLDQRAREHHGIPGAALMECAGAASAAVMRERFPGARRIACLVGPGNNGGDAAVVARRLHDAGLDVWLVVAADQDRIAGDALTMLRAARSTGVGEGVLDGADLVVDGLFGTGFHGVPEGRHEQLIRELDALAAPVVSLDVPSGVDAATGEAAGAAVRAAVTVCFHGRALGTAIAPGRVHAGEVVVADIGLPARDAPEPGALLVELSDLALRRRRPPEGTKYDAGSVLVVGGSPGMSGAPTLASRAAMRAGAGIVWAAVRPSEAHTVAGLAPEVIVHERGDDPAEVLEWARRASAVVVGPGLGRERDARPLVDAVVAGVEAPLLLDADALFALAGRLGTLRRRPGPTALTPHEAELGRLLGRPRAEVAAHRLEAVTEAARLAGCAVLLKGPDTLVASPGEPLRVVICDVPALATAGAGDVLSGVGGALLARGTPPALALALAAAAHGAAAAEAAALNGTLLASDLELPLGRLLG